MGRLPFWATSPKIHLTLKKKKSKESAVARVQKMEGFPTNSRLPRVTLIFRIETCLTGRFTAVSSFKTAAQLWV